MKRPTRDELEAALRWMIDNGAVYRSGGDGRFSDGGCGCCADALSPPDEVRAVVDYVGKAVPK